MLFFYTSATFVPCGDLFGKEMATKFCYFYDLIGIVILYIGICMMKIEGPHFLKKMKKPNKKLFKRFVTFRCFQH
jgi:hypothetical protein